VFLSLGAECKAGTCPSTPSSGTGVFGAAVIGAVVVATGEPLPDIDGISEDT
jgi:hypothetical protein